MSASVLDVEQHLLLLELQAPFDKRDVQLARRRMAKRWHPDLAPQGRQFEHERHLKAINQAADQLERLAEGSRGGRVSSSAVRASAAAAGRKREEDGRRAYEAEQRARARAQERARHDPFASRVPDHSVVHRYARCLAYPEWGVGSVTGIYFSADPDGGDEVQQWARVRFSHGVRTVPAGSMRFVDFSKPDPAAERVERFMTAAQRAMAEGEYQLAAQRLVYARNAEPRNVAVLRQMTLAFWYAGDLEAAARSVRDWARVEGTRPAAHRFAARIYEDIGAIDLAATPLGVAPDRVPVRARGAAWLQDVDRARDDQTQRHQRDDRLHAHDALGHRRERHRVGGRERGGVRQRHVQVVDEGGPPVQRLDAVIRHLGEQEVRRLVASGRALAGAAAIQLPVPQREDEEVRQPDEHPRDDQLAP